MSLTNSMKLHVIYKQQPERTKKYNMQSVKQYKWIPIEEKEHPSIKGTYKCTLNDGNVYDVFGTYFANGWFWEFERKLEIKFQVELGTKPKVIAWFPNPDPYIPSKI